MYTRVKSKNIHDDKLYTGVIFDYTNIIDVNNLSLLKTHIIISENIKNIRNALILLFLIIPNEQYKKLETLPLGVNRINYINSESFVNDIQYSTFLVYNQKKSVCEIYHGKTHKYDYIHDIMDMIIKTTMSNLPNDVILLIKLSKNYYRNIDMYINLGFENPYFFENNIYMTRENNMVDISNDKKSMIKFMLKSLVNDSKKYCSIKCKITDKTLMYLENISKIGSTINSSGDISQKEIAGKFYISKYDNELVNLDIDKNSIIHGIEEGVKIVDGIYNFHSHPKSAYDKYKVHLGWPSSQDYVGFLSSILLYDTILHIVSSIEGLYVISASDYILKNEINEKIIVDINKFILKNYNVLCKNGDTIEYYINKINNIKYQGMFLFKVQFFSWSSKTRIFQINFAKKDRNCFFNNSVKKAYIKTIKKV